jgi:hypothetical protein
MNISKKQKQENLKSTGETLAQKFNGTIEVLSNECTEVKIKGLIVYLSYENNQFMTVEVCASEPLILPLQEISELCQFLGLMNFKPDNFDLILTNSKR